MGPTVVYAVTVVLVLIIIAAYGRAAAAGTVFFTMGAAAIWLCAAYCDRGLAREFVGGGKRQTARPLKRVLYTNLFRPPIMKYALETNHALEPSYSAKLDNTKQQPAPNLVRGLDADYSAWKISQALLQHMCAPTAPAVGPRCRVILEGWISKRFSKAIKHGRVPELSAPYGALEFALRDPESLLAAMRLAQIDAAAIERVGREVRGLIAALAGDPLKYALPRPAQSSAHADSLVQESASGWTAGDFRLAKTPRLVAMAGMAGPAAMVRCCLRYGSMLAASHHWAAPAAVFDALWRLGVRNEGFASPLNSGLFGRADCRFFSLFKDTDAPFGSCGSVFAQPVAALAALPGGWELNPPFVFGLMMQAAELAVALAKTRDVVFIVRQHDPAVNPVSPYAALADAAVASIVMPAGTYAYEAATAAGNVLKASTFPSHILYAGPRSAADAAALLESVRCAWPAAPARLVSAFDMVRDGARLAQQRANGTVDVEDFWRPIAEALVVTDPVTAPWRTAVPDTARGLVEQGDATLSSILRIAMMVGLRQGTDSSADSSAAGNVANSSVAGSAADYLDEDGIELLSKQITPSMWTKIIQLSKFE